MRPELPAKVAIIPSDQLLPPRQAPAHGTCPNCKLPYPDYPNSIHADEYFPPTIGRRRSEYYRPQSDSALRTGYTSAATRDYERKFSSNASPSYARRYDDEVSGEFRNYSSYRKIFGFYYN